MCLESQKIRKMNNRGETTIYLLLILLILLSLVGAVYCGVIVELGRARVDMVATGLEEHLLADYQRELFERYHMLTLDTTYGSGSEAGLEELAVDYLEDNLGADSVFSYRIEEVLLEDYHTLVEDNCREFRRQMKSDLLYHGGDIVFQKLLQDSQSICMVPAEGKTRKKEYGEIIGIGEDEYEIEEVVDALVSKPELQKDWDEIVTELLSSNLMKTIYGARAMPSKEKIVLEHVPSHTRKAPFKTKICTIKNREDLGQWMREAQGMSISLDTMLDRGAELTYASTHFTNALPEDMGDEQHSFKLEQEYLIAGKSNDYDNANRVLTMLGFLRFVQNYQDLKQDKAKQQELELYATAISVLLEQPEAKDGIKELLGGMWSYMESISDLKLLMKGEKVPLDKGECEWNTGLLDLISVKHVEGTGYAKGLDYEQYLMILMVLFVPEKTFNLRMLDVMQLNISTEEYEADLNRFATAITMSGSIRQMSNWNNRINEKRLLYHFRKETGYENDTE